METASAPTDLGSGGGSFDYLGGGSGGAGGGAIKLIATGTLTLDGDITANGQSINTTRADGGGSGEAFTSRPMRWQVPAVSPRTAAAAFPLAEAAAEAAVLQSITVHLASMV